MRGPRRERRILTRWRRLYGASPLQLLALAASLTVCAYAASRLLAGGHVINVLAWFGLALIGHDLVLVPLYSALDRISGAAASRRAANAINYLRVPAAISGVLLLVYFPAILGLNATNYRADTGHDGGVYLRRWLLISAALFLVAGVAGALRARSGSTARHPPQQ
jgi:hypothetical protein